MKVKQNKNERRGKMKRKDNPLKCICCLKSGKVRKLKNNILFCKECQHRWKEGYTTI